MPLLGQTVDGDRDAVACQYVAEYHWMINLGISKVQQGLAWRRFDCSDPAMHPAKASDLFIGKE